jgi:Ca2+-binding RTX toxin-like protein
MAGPAARLLALATLLVLSALASSARALPPSYPCTDIGPKPTPATIVGSNGNDTLTGTPERDVIAGLGGDDVIDGGGGNDLICGGDGNDRIGGRAGEDVLSGDAGDDVVDGGTQPANGVDFVAFDGSPAAVKVSLAAGTAVGWGSDRLSGMEGVSGSPIADSLTGDAGGNVLLGQRGNDVLSGSRGSDLLSGTEGNDVLRGGPGADLALYEHSPRAVRVDLSRGTARGWGRDRLRSIEDVVGSARGDRIYGGKGANYLWGLGGADFIDGRGGRDHAFGGPGRDRCVRSEVRSSC